MDEKSKRMCSEFVSNLKRASPGLIVSIVVSDGDETMVGGFGGSVLEKLGALEYAKNEWLLEANRKDTREYMDGKGFKNAQNN